MNGNDRMSPRKIILAMVVTGIVIVASVGGIFMAADSVGLISTTVSVTGQVQGSNATQCELFVDGVSVDTAYISGYPYEYYQYNRNYYFYNVKVKANADHDFQVITSLGEKSDIVTEYTPYSESTRISLSIVKKQVQVTVRGEYKGNVTGTTSVSLYVNENSMGNDMVSSSNPEFSITAMVYENCYYTFRLTASNYYYEQLTNVTTVYVGSVPMTITMDIE